MKLAWKHQQRLARLQWHPTPSRLTIPDVSMTNIQTRHTDDPPDSKYYSAEDRPSSRA